MNDFLIRFSSITHATKAKKILEGHTINSLMQKTPQKLSEGSCGYCLRLNGSTGKRAAQILKQFKIRYKGCYIEETGGYAKVET